MCMDRCLRSVRAVPGPVGREAEFPYAPSAWKRRPPFAEGGGSEAWALHMNECGSCPLLCLESCGRPAEGEGMPQTTGTRSELSPNGVERPLPPRVVTEMEAQESACEGLCPSGPTLFGLCDTGEMFASCDRGWTWSLYSILPEYDPVAMHAGFAPGEWLLASQGGLVYRSADAGLEWICRGAMPCSDVVSMAMPPDGSLVFLTAGGTVFRSFDRGVSFERSAVIAWADCTDMKALGDGRLLALAQTGRMAESRDAILWKDTAALPVGDALCLGLTGDGIFAITSSGRVYRSSTDEVRWSFLSVLSRPNPAALICDRDALFIAFGDGTVAASPDGRDWEQRGSIGKPGMRVLACEYERPAAERRESMIG